MTLALLDRQISLLEYLTSEDAIFGPAKCGFRNPGLEGFDIGLLRLEASFSHEKRMEKVAHVFHHTFRLLGRKQAEIVREFTARCPPREISRIENARQFYEFMLQNKWPDPPYLHDVAACEFALARARLAVESGKPDVAQQERNSRRSVRRKPGVVLLNCHYDVRAIFEAEDEQVAPVERITPLAVAVPPGAQHPQVFEVPAAVFRMLTALDDWTPVSELPSSSEFDDLLRELAENGLVELRP